MNKFSIITPILQVDNNFKRNFKSVLKNKDKNFNYIIVANTNLMQKLKSIVKNFFFIHIIEEKKTLGLYSAINLALKSNYCNNFYVILGQDDFLINSNFSKEINEEINKKNDKIADILTLKTYTVQISKRKPNLGKENIFYKSIVNLRYIFAHHTGGMLIKKNLHKKFGYYSEKYKISSDYFFLKKIKRKIFIKRTKIISAKIGYGGISAREPLLSLFERYLIDLSFNNKFNLHNFLYFVYSLYKQSRVNHK